jgi:hypothetical protein
MAERTPTALEQLQKSRNDSMSANIPADILNTQFLNKGGYDFNMRKFPNDLGEGYQKHYMVININVPVTLSGRNAITQGNLLALLGGPQGGQLSRLDSLRFVGAGNSFTGLNSLVPRFTRRIAESIALYMPPNIVYNTHNEYEDISLSALGGQLTVAALRTSAAFRARRNAQQQALNGAASNIISAGQVVGQVSSLVQSPINPAIEILFSNTLQRQFVFEFLLAPRTEEESKNIKEIIRTLRFHAAPEVGSLAGLNWIPPAEFDIAFFKDGKENTNIPRINTCVLERIEVDVTPTGIYSTFSNGHPVATRLSLGFRELEPVHKRRIEQGF